MISLQSVNGDDIIVDFNVITEPYAESGIEYSSGVEMQLTVFSQSSKAYVEEHLTELWNELSDEAYAAVLDEPAFDASSVGIRTIIKTYKGKQSDDKKIIEKENHEESKHN